MIFLIGLGVHDAKDMSIKGLEAAKKCDKLYLESYTSVFSEGEAEEIEKLVGKVKILKREEIEGSEFLIEEGKEKNIGLLVRGDPMCATTHIELFLRAKKAGVQVKIMHSSSIFSAIASTGLQIYKFGKTVSLPQPEKYFPTSPYEGIEQNLKNGLHTLILLDVKEKYMHAKEALEILLKLEEKIKKKIISKDMKVLVARLGGKDQLIKYGEIEELINSNLGKPPHVIIIPGKLHFMEEEALELWR